MAVVEMKKLNLIAMSYDKDEIFDSLQSTGAVEITTHADTENTFVPAVFVGDLREELSATESALEVLSKEVTRYEADHHVKGKPEKDGFLVNYQKFLAAKDNRDEMRETVAEINRLLVEKQNQKSSLATLDKQIAQARPYAGLTNSFDYYASTDKVQMRLGMIPDNKLDDLQKACLEDRLVAMQVLGVSEGTTLVLVASHKTDIGWTDGILSTLGFSASPYTGTDSGKETFDRLIEQRDELVQSMKENERAMYDLKGKIKDLKIYADHLIFALEKAEADDKLRATTHTFLMQAYVPVGSEQAVTEAVEKVSKATYLQFSDLTDEDTPPTLLKNNGLVSNFEGITNTYSAPNYKEMDPNTVMSFFYALFMGFIMGDVGYGVLMAIVGAIVWFKGRKYPTGMSKLAGVFAVAGIFAMMWGALFNSVFGFAALPVTFLPNPQNARCTFVGIEMPSVLALCLVIGVWHIGVGYLCKAWQYFRKKKIFDGICEGITWAFFSLGLGLAIIGLTKYQITEGNVAILEYLSYVDLSWLVPIGGIMAGVSLLLATLTAGRHEKFFGKFTKGFGAVYGIIGFASDIVSYARLYGLMLSGAVIAGIIANAVGNFFASGNILLIMLAIILFVVGNIFNLVIGLLGAYIHDARLQYVEFYGRFYEGEGELFAPLGSSQKYVRLTHNNV